MSIAKRRAIVDRIEADMIRLRQRIAEGDHAAALLTRLEDRLATARHRLELVQAAEQEARDMRHRMATRVRELSKRLYKDTDGDEAAAHQDRWWLRPRLELPEPVKQPGDDAPTLVPPPREGLIAGTWRAAPSRALDIILDRHLPKTWNAHQVGFRLIEAHRVLRRVPMVLGPNAGGSPWPAFKTAAADDQQPATKTRVGASADEIARMTEAISWPWQYLGENGNDVNRWAHQTTAEEFESIVGRGASVPWGALDAIAVRLNLDKVVVR